MPTQVGAASPALRFEAALSLHRQGRAALADAACAELLRAEPAHSGAWHLCGLIALQRGDAEHGIEAIRRSLQLSPMQPAAHTNLGNGLLSLGRPEQALVSFQQALQLQSDFAPAWHNRGNALRDLGQNLEALASYDQALRLDSSDALVHYNRGRLLLAMRRAREALTSLDRALRLNPKFSEAQQQRIAALSALGRAEQALRAAESLLRMLPNHPDAYAAHGSVLLTLGRYEAALSEFDKARTLAPTSVLILNQYANALLKLRRVGEALEFYGQVLKLQPGNADGHHNRGSALLQLHQYQAAIDSYDEALRLHAARPETLIGKSHALSELGRHMEARACLDQAWHLNPKHDFLAGQALLARLEICDWSDYLQHCANLATAVGAGERAIAPLAFVMVSDSAALQLECARIHAQAHWGGVAAGPSAPRGYGHERVRIAYVTANLAEHPVSYLMSGVFEAHDRERFELIAIALQPAEDSAAGRRAAGAFSRVIDVSAESDAEAAALLRALEVDIAVDLMGYTKQARPGIFAHRAAPVQINYLGFPGTMGAPFMDYILADEFVIPPSRCASFAEQVVYLPGCFQANDDRRIIASPPTRAEAGLPEHNLVFCSFNKSSKLNPILFDVWCRILCAVEGSVLWLVADGAQTPGNLHREAARRGLDPGRLVFAAPLPYAQHLGRLGLADLFLDTLPFNAGTTCSDALWAGLPVLTCAGDALAARMAGSLLRAAGLPELVTYSLQEYEQRAFELANEPRRLTELRQRLAENRLRQPLFDTARFCRHLELAFMQMRATAERGLPPKGFAVEPLQLDV